MTKNPYRTYIQEAIVKLKANVFGYFQILMHFQCKYQQDLGFYRHHNFAVVRGAENYNTIKSSFREVLRDINRLIERGFILVEGHLVPVEMFLGGTRK